MGKSELQASFQAQYNVKPEVYSRAPGRLEILGNHTDYNEGFVLSCAVGQSTEFALARRSGRICRVRDLRSGSERTFSLDELGHPGKGDWANYLKGVIVELGKRGIEVPAFDAVFRSQVPLSAGMSSSAALEIGFGFALRQMVGIDSLSKADWARVGQGVENNYLKVNTGLLDQFSSIFGHQNELIYSDFRTVEVLRTVKVPEKYLFAVVNSMQKHNLVDSEYNVRRIDCENAARKLATKNPKIKALRDVSLAELEAGRDLLTEREYRRALHVVGECERVVEGVRLLEQGDAEGFGKLLFASHESSRVNFENSTPELDQLVELAHSIPGCVGARLSGGGFGGISIHMVERESAAEYARRIRSAYQLRTKLDPEVILCDLGEGAQSSAY
ncbi:MAG: galactokinase [Victivallaceae bacterium]|nr:galactokinase [Victivallaceae bacterium]